MQRRRIGVNERAKPAPGQSDPVTPVAFLGVAGWVKQTDAPTKPAAFAIQADSKLRLAIGIRCLREVISFDTRN